MNSKIYVPNYTLQKYPCVVYSENNIRAYYSVPQPNRTISYDIFYIRNHYDSFTYQQTFGNNIGNIQCVPNHRLTDDVYYRHDIDSILILFIIFVLVGFIFPFKLIMKLFKRGAL